MVSQKPIWNQQPLVGKKTKGRMNLKWRYDGETDGRSEGSKKTKYVKFVKMRTCLTHRCPIFSPLNFSSSAVFMRYRCIYPWVRNAQFSEIWRALFFLISALRFGLLSCYRCIYSKNSKKFTCPAYNASSLL